MRVLNVIFGLLFVLGVMSVQGGLINVQDILATPANITGSGNGTLDWRLFTASGGEIGNDDPQGAYNYDNANNTLPGSNKGGGSTGFSFAESFVTSGAELKSYYRLNFPSLTGSTGEVEIVLFLDLNETGGGGSTNLLSKMDIVLNPTSINGLLLSPYTDDIQGGGNKTAAGDQAYIDQIYSGGTLLSELDPAALTVNGDSANLPLNEQGAGWADYSIFTGIDPFALADDDVVLFNISMGELNSGAEEIFLSGTYNSNDIIQAIPEPMAASFICLAGLGMLSVKRIFKKV